MISRPTASKRILCYKLGSYLLFSLAHLIIFRAYIELIGTSESFSSFSLRSNKPFRVEGKRIDFLKNICSEENLRSAVEVGVKQGYFSEVILSSCSTITDFTGVDLWATQKSYDDSANVAQTDQNSYFEESKTRLAKFEGRWRLVKGDSLAVSTTFPDSSIDFIYLDARHDYRSVIDDIAAWAPKVRPGGILAGHDFLDLDEYSEDAWRQYKDGTISHTTKAVRSAVTEFAARTNRQVVVTYNDLWQGKPFPSWFIRM